MPFYTECMANQAAYSNLNARKESYNATRFVKLSRYRTADKQNLFGLLEWFLFSTLMINPYTATVAFIAIQFVITPLSPKILCV